jgi:hypothetical protein
MLLLLFSAAGSPAPATPSSPWVTVPELPWFAIEE